MINFTPAEKEKLEAYLVLLKKWQAKINLVSKTTLEDAWQRHILDSAQLLEVINHDDTPLRLLDLGAGAGFPGMVLAILRPQWSVTLVESDERKCIFMQTVSRETEINVRIINERIEDVTPVAVDVVTARALASLDQLLDYAAPFKAKNPDLKCVFLKGRRAAEEIEDAQAKHQFEHAEYPSLTDPEAKIVHISF